MSNVRGEPLPGEERDADELRVHAVGSIGQVSAAEWDACANPMPYAANATAASLPAEDQENVYNPFISYDFLSALEESGSVGEQSGWQVRHLIVKDTGGALLATAPCYVKSHSRGEYVFDRGWAEAYERAGGDYYPKLQVAVPFTPATGRRLLVKPGPHADIARQPLAAGLIELCRVEEASGVHVTFAPEAECQFLGEHEIPAPHRPAVSLGEFRLRHVRRFPRRAFGAQA